MSKETERHEMTKKKVVYHIPETDEVKLRQDIEYRVTDAGVLTMDIYYPPDSRSETRSPAAIFISGYSDPGFQKMLGCKLKDMEFYISWGKLMAASGVVAITYTTGNEPAADTHALLQYVRNNSVVLGIDENRIGLWAGSGNVPNALSVLMQGAREYLRCAVLCYGFMLDCEGTSGVADAAKQIGFVNPCAGKSLADLPPDIPLFVVRAGQDEMPHLNETIDSFLNNALSCNIPITFVNHAAAPHAFDLMHDSETSREIIRQIVRFMQFHLLA